MAQPNVAREPSMEEILASIRRIIENNDPENGDAQSQPSASEAVEDSVVAEAPQSVEAVFPGMAVAVDADIGEDLSGVEDIHLTVDDHFAEMDEDSEEVQAEPASQPVNPPRQAPSKPNTLADVAARVRASAEAQQAAAADSPLMTSRMAGVMSAGASAEQAVARVPGQQGLSSAVTANEDDAPEAALTEELPAPENSILSDETGMKVARSFGELAVALNAQASRSLDEIAEEMMRPMLREWLDDNLPTLVERLVREEIERVARGPRG